MVKEEVDSGRMEGVDIFFMTDNALSEEMYSWGKSRNEEIFELMLWLV